MALSADLQAHLETGTTTLCRCWAVTRRDGELYGFTDHDLDFEEVRESALGDARRVSRTGRERVRKTLHLLWLAAVLLALPASAATVHFDFSGTVGTAAGIFDGLVGSPVDEICGLAKKYDADLIVVGTHGRRGVSRLLLGSVAEGVLRSASSPVLVVRQKKWK